MGVITSILGWIAARATAALAAYGIKFVLIAVIASFVAGTIPGCLIGSPEDYAKGYEQGYYDADNQQREKRFPNIWRWLPWGKPRLGADVLVETPECEKMLQAIDDHLRTCPYCSEDLTQPICGECFDLLRLYFNCDACGPEPTPVPAVE